MGDSVSVRQVIIIKSFEEKDKRKNMVMCGCMFIIYERVSVYICEYLWVHM